MGNLQDSRFFIVLVIVYLLQAIFINFEFSKSRFESDLKQFSTTHFCILMYNFVINHIAIFSLRSFARPITFLSLNLKLDVGSIILRATTLSI